MNNLLKIFCFSMLGLSMAVVASASEVNGSLSTGIDTGVTGVVVALPEATPSAGTYTAMQSVALSATGATSIHYTFDGTEPNCQSATYYTGAPIPVGQSLTLKALSCYANDIHSAVVSFPYVINIAIVTPTPSGGGGGGGGGYTPPVLPATPVVVVGDIDGSGKVDIIDFASMMANWGKTGTNASDLNNDLSVDIIDFALLMANWSL